MKKIKFIFVKMWEWIRPYFTVKMLPIILTVYFFTNVSWYFIAFVNVGLPSWLMTFAKGYLIFLWSPIAIEKPIIIAISLVIYRFIYNEKFEKKGVVLNGNETRCCKNNG